MIYEEQLKSTFDELGVAKKMTLATSVNDIVSARTISVLILGGRFYFQTDKNMDKGKEISFNEHVALAVGNIQIKGICKELGHPTEKQNEEFLTHFKEHYNSAYTKYSHLENERVYEITPTLIKLWKYTENTPCIEFIDCEKQTCSLLKYDI